MARRLPKSESPRALQARLDYLAMGPARSFAKLAVRYRKDAEAGQLVPTLSEGQIAIWSEAHGWGEFVLNQMAKDQEHIEAAERDRRVQMATNRLNEGTVMHSIAAKMLWRIKELIDQGALENMPYETEERVVPFETVTTVETVNRAGEVVTRTNHVKSSRVMRRTGVMEYAGALCELIKTGHLIEWKELGLSADGRKELADKILNALPEELRREVAARIAEDLTK